MYHISILSSIDGHLGCFHVLTIVNSAAMNIGMHVSFLIRAFVFFVYMYHFFCTHSSIDGCLGFFHVLAIVNSAAMNTGVHVSSQTMVFSGHMSRSWIART